MDHDGIGTDEQTATSVVKKRDMDAKFFVGCMTIAALSIVFFALEIWPFFAFQTATKSGLIGVALSGCLPALLIGAIIVRKIGLEGGTALIGGTVSASVFAFLRMDMQGLGRFDPSESLVVPDYPAFWVWLMPVIWALLVTSLTLFLLPQGQEGDEVSRETDR